MLTAGDGRKHADRTGKASTDRAVASDSALRDGAEMHRRIHPPIRAHDPDGARHAMNAHFVEASEHQAREHVHLRLVAPAGPSDSRPPRRRRRQPSSH